jgi:hypothetical protein
LGIVVKVDFDMRWKRPIHIGEDDLLTYAIITPGEAISIMRTRFHFRDSESYRRAWQSCHGALAGEVSLAAARKHFLAAYTEDYIRFKWSSQKRVNESDP